MRLERDFKERTRARGPHVLVAMMLLDEERETPQFIWRSIRNSITTESLHLSGIHLGLVKLLESTQTTVNNGEASQDNLGSGTL